VGGAVYGFNSFTRHELLRVHVLNVEWWPLGLLFLLRWVGTRRLRDALGLSGALALQGLSGAYYLIYTALVAPLWVAGAWLLARRPPAKQELQQLAVAVAACGLPAAAIVSPYLAQYRAMGFEKSWAAGADILAYLEPEPGNLLWGWLRLLVHRAEVPHFVGVFGLGMIGLGLAAGLRRAPWRPVTLLAAGTGAVGFLLSLGPAVRVGERTLAPGPYRLLHDHAPLLRGMASPERIGVLVVFAGAILAGLAAARLLERARAWRGAATLALLALLVAEHWSPARAAAAAPTGSSVPGVYRWLAEGRSPVVEVPVFPDRSLRLRSAYLYFSTYHWRPIPIGRTSFYPPAHGLLAFHLDGFPDATSLLLLERLGIRDVVVHPLAWPEAERAERLAAIEAEARLRLVRAFDDAPEPRFAALGLGRERAYRLVGDSPPPPRLCEPEDEIPRGGWAFAHSGRKRPELVRDGDRRTAWFTHDPQRPGDFMAVTFPRVETLAALAVGLYYPFEEFPRRPAVEVSQDGETWRRVAHADGPEERWALVDALVRAPREARAVYRIKPTPARAVRLVLAGGAGDDAWPQWSVPELRAYRACR
jgi:hypothetical protein